jgi:hypothetical protein
MLLVHVITLTMFGIASYAARYLFGFIPADRLANSMGHTLMTKVPKPVMMIAMAIPEQLVLGLMEPQIAIFDRLMVSVCMYVVHFGWNGFVNAPKRAYNEIPWILATALYASRVLGVANRTAFGLIAADSVMVLFLRGLVAM